MSIRSLFDFSTDPRPFLIIFILSAAPAGAWLFAPRIRAAFAWAAEVAALALFLLAVAALATASGA